MAPERAPTGNVSIADLLPGTFQQMEAYCGGRGEGLNTGFAELNRLTGGFRPGDLVVIAGRPSVGKTALALSMARRAVAADISGLYVSLESPAWQLAERLVCSEAHVSMYDLRAGRIPALDWPGISIAASALAEQPLLFNDICRVVADVRDAAEAADAGKSLGFVIVDSLALLEPGALGSGAANPKAECLRHLKLLALDLEVVVMATVHLPRLHAGVEEDPPSLADLPAGECVEPLADLVLLLHRVPAHGTADKSSAAEFQIALAKHRNGPAGLVTLAFHPATGRLEPLAGWQDVP